MRIIVLALFFISCASVKKTETRYDSSSTIKLDSVHITLYDSVTKIVEKEEYFTKTITYYDTLWVTKDSMITIPKYTETYTRGTKEKQTDNKLTKNDSIVLNRTESTQISIVDKKKVTTANNFWKALMVLIILITAILIYWRRK